MEKIQIKELVDKINNAKIKQDEYWEEFQYNEKLEKLLPEDTILVREGLKIDKHRWYQTSIMVYKTGDSFIGIRYATDIFSEQMVWDDIGWTIEAFPMKEIKIVSYEKE